jgi:hypothetical protein
MEHYGLGMTRLPQARHHAARVVAALVGVSLLSVTAPPPAAAPQCQTINAEDDSVLVPSGPDCPSPVGFCAASDRVQGNHGFSGTFFFQALAFEPIASDPAGRLVVSGISTFTTPDGTISDVSVFDPASPQGTGTGTFSVIGRISSGTRRFAGATGDVFTAGRTREGGTAFTTNTTLEICFP